MGSHRQQQREFFRGLFAGLGIVWPILSALLLVIVASGLVVAMLEGWPLTDGLYFAFISALTIGYGDFAPTMLVTRALAILAGLCGAISVALMAAVAVKAFNDVHAQERER